MYDKTPEEIKAAIKSSLTKIDTREGSFADDVIGPTAVELSNFYNTLKGLQHIVWVDENSGEYLDLAAEDIGIEPRKPGTKAQVTLQITGDRGHTIPKGAAFLTADNLYFVTTEALTIPQDGVVNIKAEAQEVGAAYNVPAGSIIYQFSNDARISAVTNPAAAQGGTDPESDASLYERIRDARQKPSTSGNKYDYERWAKEVDGVGAAKVFPLHEGPGTVLVVIAGPDRLPVDDAVVQSCKEHIEEVRPIGAAVTVRSAQSLDIVVSVTVQLEPGADQTAVQAAFLDALEDYFASIAFVENKVLYSRVGGLLINIPGVVDYTDLTLNGEAASVELGAQQVPVIGEVVITWS